MSESASESTGSAAVLLVTETPDRSLMLAHDAGPGHPERPDRLRAVHAELASLPGGSVQRTPPTPAERSHVERVHTRGHVESILARRGRSFVIDADTAGCPASVDAALLAAGAGVRLVEALAAGEAKRGFALVRPPGHHAESNRAMGFCLFNTIAVAAAHAVAALDVPRVLIVDWDVHHGNGTQEIFYRRGDVLVFNVHEEGNYPGTGFIHETGEGEGAGRTVNVPLPPGSGEGDYFDVFRRVLVPIAREFDPRLVLVSAGFDAHERDPLGHMRLTERGFAALCGVVRGIADECASGRLGLVLEGGYDLVGLSRSVRACVEVLAGAEPPAIDAEPSATATKTMALVLEAHGRRGLGSTEEYPW